MAFAPMKSLLILCLLIPLLGIVIDASNDTNIERPINSAEEDLIISLPGLIVQPSFKHYSGYLSGSTDNIQLHYWLVEALGDPSEKPLLLWLNGGPGCSSLMGLLTENGPFLVKEHGKLEPNPYSWNRFANVLYLESPGGVGFSYVKDGNLTTDDDFTSLNNYHALLSFLQKFPAYNGRDFYITGESYGGVYVPLLTLRLLDNNFTDLNLKGIAVVNGFLSESFNENSQLYYFYYHGLVDENLWNDLLSSCCGDRCAAKCMFSENKSVQCMNVISALASATDGLDVYNIYGPCQGGVHTLLGKAPYPKRRFVPEKNLLFRDNVFLQMKRMNTSLESRFIIDCNDDTNSLVYLNDHQVRRALHVELQDVPVWDTCSPIVNKIYGRTYRDLKPQYMKILDHKVPIALFAGDIDTACNYLGILWFVDDLGLKMREPLEHWLYTARDGTQQVGGVHKTLYLDDTPLWYATVRGSGHMVPQDKPVAAYHLITSFLQKSSL